MPDALSTTFTTRRSPAAYVLGISGGSASGKSTLAAELAGRLVSFGPLVLNQDAYFHDWSALPPAEREERMTANHPDAVHWPALVEHVARLREGDTVQTVVPGTRAAARGKKNETEAAGTLLGPTRLLIVEGHLIFGEPVLRSLLDLKLFLDVPADERVLRRMVRDTVERGGDLARAVAWYRRDVLLNSRLYTEPTRQFADLILPWTEAREPVIDLLAAGIRAQVEALKDPKHHGGTEGRRDTEEGDPRE
jgi:uridine kinase